MPPWSRWWPPPSAGATRPGYRAVLLGGAAPPAELPPRVVTTYGLTETGSGCVYDGCPLDGVEVRIGDGAWAPSGEVLVRGPVLLRAYRDGTDPRACPADGSPPVTPDDSTPTAPSTSSAGWPRSS